MIGFGTLSTNSGIERIHPPVQTSIRRPHYLSASPNSTAKLAQNDPMIPQAFPENSKITIVSAQEQTAPRLRVSGGANQQNSYQDLIGFVKFPRVRSHVHSRVTMLLMPEKLPLLRETAQTRNPWPLSRVRACGRRPISFVVAPPGICPSSRH